MSASITYKQAWNDGFHQYQRSLQGKKPVHESWPAEGHDNPEYEIGYWNGWKEADYQQRHPDAADKQQPY